MNHISKQYTYSLISRFSLILLGILNGVLINRYLGPSLKGDYAFLLNIVNFSVLILGIGLNQVYTMQKKLGLDVDKYYSALLFMQFILYLVLASALSFVFDFQYSIFILYLIPIMVYSKNIAYLALMKDSISRNKMIIISNLIYTVFLAIIYFTPSKELLYVFYAICLREIIVIFISVLKFRFKFFSKDFNMKLLLKSILIGIVPMSATLLLTFNYSVDIIILKIFVDSYQIGLYSIGVALATLIWMLPDAFKEILFSRLSQTDKLDELLFSIKLNLIVSIIAAIFIVVFGQTMIIILYGNDYAGAYKVTTLIFLGAIPMVLFKLINTIFVVHGKQKISLTILFVTLIINVFLNFILIPTMDINGAALSSLISYMFCGLTFLIIFMKQWNVKFNQVVFFNKNEMKSMLTFIKGLKK